MLQSSDIFDTTCKLVRLGAVAETKRAQDDVLARLRNDLENGKVALQARTDEVSQQCEHIKKLTDSKAIVEQSLDTIKADLTACNAKLVCRAFSVIAGCSSCCMDLYMKNGC